MKEKPRVVLQKSKRHQHLETVLRDDINSNPTFGEKNQEAKTQDGKHEEDCQKDLEAKTVSI